VLSLNFHPGTKMRLLASASNDNSVKLWNIDTGNEIATLRGHADKINNSLDYIVRFSPDGKLLATTGNDKTLVLWDFDLDRLMKLACSWSGDYLKTNPNISTNDRKLCQETLKG
jgi:WD40 repeat protein